EDISTLIKAFIKGILRICREKDGDDKTLRHVFKEYPLVAEFFLNQKFKFSTLIMQWNNIEIPKKQKETSIQKYSNFRNWQEDDMEFSQFLGTQDNNSLASKDENFWGNLSEEDFNIFQLDEAALSEFQFSSTPDNVNNQSSNKRPASSMSSVDTYAKI